jgi:CPA2 family monovalent cation:H+ antiporter-2
VLPLLASGDPLVSVLVLLGGGLASLAIAAYTGLPFLLALILLGALLGPEALGLAARGRAVELLAELGVAFLLFDVGLHLSARTLWSARRYLFAFAPLQIGLCTLALAALFAAVPGLGAVGWWLPATLALSSTAVVVQILRDSGEEQTPIGRAALAVLLAQDLFVIALLVLLPKLAGETGAADALAAILPALLRLAVALAVCVLAGRFVLAPLLAWIARQGRAEAFTAAALFSVLSIAWLTHAIGLSLALGAFLAGVALAESRYASLVQGEVAPFRGLLLSLFFLSVGMSIEVSAVGERLPQVAVLTGGVLGVKTLATLLAARAIGKGVGAALRLGLTLAQGSEFAFVVMVVAGTHGLLAAEARAQVEAAVVASIALTPILARAGARAAARLDAGALAAPAEIPERRVALIGFDDTMEAVARALDRAALPFVAFTSDRERAADARACGFEVHYADSERPRGLALAAAGRASAIVIGVDDDEHGLELVQQARRLAPDIPVYAVTGRPDLMYEMELAGARDVVTRGEMAARSLAEKVLLDLDVRPRDVEECVEECSERALGSVGGAVTA